MKVLVADDDPEVREVLVEFLTLHGLETLQARNGLEALLHVKREAPDAILLDLRMPRLGGIDALTRIHKLNPAIRVVVITAEAGSDLTSQALGHGAHAVLAKPVVLTDVLTALGIEAAAAEAAAAPASLPPAASALHVLVVDDDEAVREALVEFLESRKFRVSQAPDGASAVRAIAERPPDVVLLDIDMPGLSGTEALPTIRAMAPRAAVIMVSGTADEEVAKRALARGAFDYVVKPVNFEYLARGLETALAMKSLGLE
jgi:CheY-like chemotaxis protein